MRKIYFPSYPLNKKKCDLLIMARFAHFLRRLIGIRKKGSLINLLCFLQEKRIKLVSEVIVTHTKTNPKSAKRKFVTYGKSLRKVCVFQSCNTNLFIFK